MITAIAALTPRRRGTVEGAIVNVVVFERPWVRTEIEIDDGTGRLVLRFDGRRGVPGFAPGSRVVAEGTSAEEGGVLVMRNPRYEFSAAAEARR